MTLSAWAFSRSSILIYACQCKGGVVKKNRDFSEKVDKCDERKKKLIKKRKEETSLNLDPLGIKSSAFSEIFRFGLCTQLKTITPINPTAQIIITKPMIMILR